MYEMRIETPSARATRRQAGMTLIELAVVLLVLVGLAGMLMPYVSGYVDKTHDAANSTSEKELASAILRFDTEFQRLPDNLDSLVNWDGTAATPINYTIAQVAMGNTLAAAYGMAPRTLSAVAPATAGADAALCGSLRKAGMTQFKSMDADGTTVANFSPTFNYYTGTDIDFGASGPCTGVVMELTNDAKIAQAVGLDVNEVTARRTAGSTFIAAGVSTASELMGRTVQDAPVHFAKSGTANAANAYNRLLAIFEVDNRATVNATGASRARFVGTAMAMHDLLGIDSALAGYHNGVANN